MASNPLVRLILNKEYNDALDKIEAMHVLGVVDKDTMETVSNRVSGWGLVLTSLSSESAAKEIGVATDPKLFAEAFVARGNDCALVGKAFENMNAEDLKPLAEPLPEKFLPVLEKARDVAMKRQEANDAKARRLITGLDSVFSDVMGAVCSCETCAPEKKAACTLPWKR